MTAILKEDPLELAQTSSPVPPALDRIVRRCLEKSPEQRFQSAKDLSFALAALSGSDSSAAARVGAAPRKFPVLPLALIVLTAAIASAVTWLVIRHPSPTVPMRFSIPVAGEVSHMALSADGSTLAFVSPDPNSQLPVLFVQRIGSSEARPLPGTEGASYPFWSPDGAYVAFFAKGKLQKTSVAGGTPQFLASVLSARGGSWGTQDVIVYAPDAGGELWRVNGDGTGARPLTTLLLQKDEDTHRWPLFLPDGNRFLFWAGNFGDVKTDRSSGIFVSSLDAKGKQLVLRCHSNFAITAGQLIYANDAQQLVSLAFDPSRAQVSGSVNVLAESVGYQSSVFWAALAAARNGTVVYNETSGATRSVLTWVDRSGKELGRLGAPAVMANPAISPDGSRVALDISDRKANAVEVWIERADGSTSTRFTFDASEDVVPVWSHDGTTLAYRKNAATGPSLVVKKATGLEPDNELLGASNTDDALPTSWSADDKQILFMYMRESKMGSDFELVPTAGGKPFAVLPGQGHKTNGQISPDGKWLAYASDESGDWEIYVTTFPGAAGKWQVSRGGGTEPRWRGDTKEIFYLAPGGLMTAVPVSTMGTFSPGGPVSLFQFHGRAPISSTDMFSYDVTKDGKRFLVNRYVKPDIVPPLTIVLHAEAKSSN